MKMATRRAAQSHEGHTDLHRAAHAKVRAGAIDCMVASCARQQRHDSRGASPCPHGHLGSGEVDAPRGWHVWYYPAAVQVCRADGHSDGAQVESAGTHGSPPHLFLFTRAKQVTVRGTRLRLERRGIVRYHCPARDASMPKQPNLVPYARAPGHRHYQQGLDRMEPPTGGSSNSMVSRTCTTATPRMHSTSTARRFHAMSAR